MVDEEKGQQADAPKGQPVNPPHIKKYSYQENYDFIAGIWQQVADRAETKYFADLQAEDLVNFFREFDKLPNQQEFFQSNVQRKRFAEIRQAAVRRQVLRGALKLKKTGVAREEIIEFIRREAAVLSQRETERLVRNYCDYH